MTHLRLTRLASTTDAPPVSAILRGLAWSEWITSWSAAEEVDATGDRPPTER